MKRDTIFDKRQQVKDFIFDEKVSLVFDDMINRSVPGYATLLQIIAAIAAQQIGKKQRIYDLGCSLGGVSFTLAKYIDSSNQIIAIDNSAAMIEKLKENIKENNIANIEIHCGDIVTFNYQKAMAFIMNFTLQFIAPQQRLTLLKTIAANLQENGFLLLAQKIKANDEKIRLWHESFKALQGYSHLAIAQKRQALEKVMPIYCADEEIAQLYRAGFTSVIPVFYALSFAAWIAFK